MSSIMYSIIFSIMVGVDDRRESSIVSCSAKFYLDNQDHEIVVVSENKREKKC